MNDIMILNNFDQQINEYEQILNNYLKLNKINMDDYVELNNTNILNIKKVINIIKDFDKDFLLIFNNRYENLIKYIDNKIIFKNKILYTRLIKKSNLTYTEDQQSGLNQIIRFLTDDTQKIFGLFGYAGTGKTTTIIDFIINSIELKYINSIVFTAPTNKALNVIKNKICDQIKYLLFK